MGAASFLGTDIPEDPDTDPNFFCASAAAPHAAALGGLLLELSPGWSPQDLYQYLEATAIDMDDPLTVGFDTGFDFATGYGLVSAVAPTVSAPLNTPSPSISAWSYPNPFGPATTLRFTLPEAADIRVTVFDTKGRRVRTLVDGHLSAGAHERPWDARDVDGKLVASGVYFFRIEAGDIVLMHRSVLIK